MSNKRELSKLAREVREIKAELHKSSGNTRRHPDVNESYDDLEDGWDHGDFYWELNYKGNKDRGSEFGDVIHHIQIDFDLPRGTNIVQCFGSEGPPDWQGDSATRMFKGVLDRKFKDFEDFVDYVSEITYLADKGILPRELEQTSDWEWH